MGRLAVSKYLLLIADEALLFARRLYFAHIIVSTLTLTEFLNIVTAERKKQKSDKMSWQGIQSRIQSMAGDTPAEMLGGGVTS